MSPVLGMKGYIDKIDLSSSRNLIVWKFMTSKEKKCNSKSIFQTGTLIPVKSPPEAQSLSSVAQTCLTFCDPMDCSMPGFPVHHQLPELSLVGDAI